ncbi:hypothetical protein PoB_005599900 [Plakobranchus ocellatus]|uniref:Uncharacterized protein n=1 Tax=Plakobranchus ocellatus TaxID=259542 RepID=A0AAV4CAA8_9GAST|nr:hypothetical protein PoB_005599900 [Plakobranchus ocellatus]
MGVMGPVTWRAFPKTYCPCPSIHFVGLMVKFARCSSRKLPGWCVNCVSSTYFSTWCIPLSCIFTVRLRGAPEFISPNGTLRNSL